jgi:hypothetical protein
MAEEYTCIECENLYDDSDGDTDERMCNKCLNLNAVESKDLYWDEKIHKLNTLRSEKMNIEETQLYMNEQHRLMMRILSILEYSNLQDLLTINSFLDENGFVSNEQGLKGETTL